MISNHLVAHVMIPLASRFLTVLEKLRRILKDPFSLQPSLALALNGPKISNDGQLQTYDIQQMINDFRILLGVPKFRTSQPRKQTRKFAYNKLYKAKDNLVACPNCGEFHELHTICGKCYEKVREVTNAIKAKMMGYNPYIGERQDKPVHVRFSDDSDEVSGDKRIIEMDRARPTWFKRTIKND